MIDVMIDFWRGDAKVDLDTGFPNGRLDAATFLHPAQGKIRLVKIHGSTSWLVKSTELQPVRYSILIVWSNRYNHTCCSSLKKLSKGWVSVVPFRIFHMFAFPPPKIRIIKISHLFSFKCLFKVLGKSSLKYPCYQFY